MIRGKIIAIWLLSALLLSMGCTGKSQTPAVEANGNLPRVLLIGDSISIGYTGPVRQLLQGKADVHRPMLSPAKVENCGPTTYGVEKLDLWLGDQPWDVIHFNFGLHDLKYADAEGKLTDPAKGKTLVPVDQYRQNLETLIARLQKTNAKLIFATTTPVPEGSRGRIKGDEVKYNQAALAIMQKHNIPIDDLYTHACKNLDQIQRPRDVHYTAQGYEYLAEHVAKTILESLEK